MGEPKYDLAELWSRLKGGTPSAEVLKAREAGLKTLVAKCDVGMVECLVRLYQGHGFGGDAVRESFAKYFKAADNTFTLHENEAEVRMLAQAALQKVILDGGHPLQMLATLAVCCGTTAVVVEGELDIETQHFAESVLQQKSASVRVGLPKLAKLPGVGDGNQYDAMGKLADPTQLAQQSSNLLKANHDKLVARDLHLFEWAANVQTAFQSLSEELDTLWWLIGGRTGDGRSFASVPVEELVVSAACTLAELARHRIPVASVAHLLACAIEKSDGDPGTPISLKQLVEKCGTPSLPKHAQIGADGASAVVPVLSAIGWAGALDRSEGWHKSLREKHHIDVAKTDTPSQYAYQLLLELFYRREAARLRS